MMGQEITHNFNFMALSVESTGPSIKYAGVLLLGLVVTLIATPIMRRLAIRNHIVDWPDDNRKKHIEPVAYLGGVAIFLGWLSGVFLSYFISVGFTETGFDASPDENVPFPISVIFGATVIMVTGLIDDVYGIRPRVKVGGQFLAAAALSWSGQNLGTNLVVETAAGIGVTIPLWGAYLLGTVLIAGLVVGGCNSMNLLDGLDGLATGVASIATIGFLLLSLTLATQSPAPTHDAIRVVMCLAILGALLGFLPYNFNPAKIFMGDAGSHLLGYLCVSTILLLSDAPNGQGPMLVLAGLLIFALPIMDSTLAVLRRSIRGHSIFEPDHEHLHHQIQSWVKGFGFGPNQSVRITVLMIYLLAGFFALLGYLLVYLPCWQVFTIFLMVFMWIAYRTCQPSEDPSSSNPPLNTKPKAIKPEPR